MSDLSDPRALFAPLGEVRGLLVAVSGGPDSMALLHLAAGWQRAGGPKIFAATVDHGLRAQAREEAEQVAHWSAALGIPHQILSWTGDKPATRLQERAREARYRLLFDHAKALGADVVATGHHGDDQAETILFRLLRGSGIAGLSGMEPIAQRQGLRLARPLLGWGKADLVAYCAAQGQDVISDPSNHDPRFARTGLRALLPQLAGEGLDRAALLRLGRRAGRAAQALDLAFEGWLTQLPAQRSPGLFACPGEALRQLPSEALLRLLEAEILRVGQMATPPRLEQLEALSEALEGALREGRDHRANLAGALVSCVQGQLVVTPEPARRV